MTVLSCQVKDMDGTPIALLIQQAFKRRFRLTQNTRVRNKFDLHGIVVEGYTQLL
jgi:hypothetical protein